MGIEFIITLFAALAALWKKRDALVSTLFLAWGASALIAIVTPKELLPGAASLVDVIIAFTAYWLWSIHESQRARIVGSISLLKLGFHFGISAHFGSGDWLIYAFLVNACFVMQCIVAGGWFYGVVDFLNRISPRHPDRRAATHEKRAP